MPGDGGNRNEGAFFRVLSHPPVDIASAKSKAKKGGKLVGGARERLSHQKREGKEERDLRTTLKHGQRRPTSGRDSWKKEPFSGRGARQGMGGLFTHKTVLVVGGRQREKKEEERAPSPHFSPTTPTENKREREREREKMDDGGTEILSLLPTCCEVGGRK